MDKPRLVRVVVPVIVGTGLICLGCWINYWIHSPPNHQHAGIREYLDRTNKGYYFIIFGIIFLLVAVLNIFLPRTPQRP